jgi:hypothetical protein
MGLRPALTGVVLAAVVAPGMARADGEEGVYLRVIVETAPLRSGPSWSYRTLSVAARGDVFRVVGRGTRGFWFRVEREDGTYGWIQGDMVQPFEYDADATPSRGFLPWLFAPSPLEDAHFEIAFSAGVLATDGLFLLRPAWVVSPEVSIEGHVGETTAPDGSVLLWGLGCSIHLWPRSFFVPFAHLSAGGARSDPDADVFTLEEGTFAAVAAGGGVKIGLQKRVTLRFDFRHHAFFDPNFYQGEEEFSGGFSVFF